MNEWRRHLGTQARICSSIGTLLLIAACATACRPEGPRITESPIAELTPIPTKDLTNAFPIQPPTSGRALPRLWYAYTLGHCGIYSPVDFDGSYWIPVACSNLQGPEAINSYPGKIRRVERDLAEWRAESGLTARFERMEDHVWPWGCE